MKLKNNRYTKIITAILLGCMLIGYSSCKKFVSGYEKDPNQPTTVTLNTILSASEIGLFAVYTGNANRFEAMWMQHMDGTDRQYIGYAQYQIGPADNEYDWDNAYNGVLEDLRKMIAQAGTQTSPYYKGIGEVLEVMDIGIVTDMWGDVPFSQAGQGESNILHPAYDKQQDIYNSIQGLLDEAIADLSAPSSTFVPGLDDFIHGGDLNAWIITAHELKARFYNHLTNTGTYDASKVLAEASAAEDLGAATANDCDAQFGTAPTNNNTWFQYFYTAGRADMRMGRIVDSMLADNDPRLPVYANQDVNGSYSGSPNADGSVNTDASFPGDFYFADAVKPISMVSYVELEYVKAEAALRSGGDAATPYLAALGEDMNVNNVPSADASTYIAAHSVADMHSIMYQKWVSLYTQEEVWSDWRRTGIPNLEAVTGAGTPIPRRLVYPQSELSYNTANLPSPVPSQFDHVWFDQ